MMKITSESHADHSLQPEHFGFLLGMFGGKRAFFIETVELPPELPLLPCGLYGPLVGDVPVPEDVVHYASRGNRKTVSRLIDAAQRSTNLMTVIGGPDDSGEIILYTAYGGPVAPREPSDPGLKTDEERAEAAEFWSQHALSSY